MKKRLIIFIIISMIIFSFSLNSYNLTVAYNSTKDDLEINQKYLLDMRFQNMIFHKETGFAITHDYMFYILNFSKPPIGAIISSLQLDYLDCSDMVFHEGYLYLAKGPKGYQIIDVTDLTAPEVIYTFEPLSIQIHSIEIVEGHLFIPRYFLGCIEMYDISNPRSPVLEHSIEVLGIGSQTYDILYSQNIIQFAIDDEIVLINYLDIQTPEEDSIRIGYHLSNSLVNLYSLIEYQDCTLIFSSLRSINDPSFIKGGILKYDPTTEPYPIITNVTLFDGAFRDVRFTDSCFFVADLYGLRILELKSLNQIEEIASYEALNIWNLAMLDNYVYLMNNGIGTTTIVDISNKTNPEYYNPITYNTTNKSFLLKSNYFALFPSITLLILIRKKVKRKKSQLL